MRTAILVIAHKNQHQLNLLVERLQQDFDVYIHIDKKSTLSSDPWKKYSNVFCFSTYKINWGSYNSILATLELFKMATEKQYDYYLHISGQDLPIKTNKEILLFLENSKTTNFMDWHALPSPVWGKDGGFGRLTYYWEHNLSGNGYHIPLKICIRLFREIQIKWKIKRKLPDIQLYGGSNWVNLTHEAASYLVEYVRKHPSFLKSFKYSVNGDEIWIQTILKNSALSFDTNYLRYVDWGNSATSPDILTTKHYNDLMNSSALFARKFDEQVDTEIIYKILEVTE